MPFSPFYTLFPDIAFDETRSITVLQEQPGKLPADEYAFLEMSCNESGCDCRRVMFSVLSRKTEKMMAVISWGWEKSEFYGKWLPHSTPADILALKGPSLNELSPQSKYAPAILDLVRDILLQDVNFVERIKRHYRMFRDAIDSPQRSLRRKRKRR